MIINELWDLENSLLGFFCSIRSRKKNPESEEPVEIGQCKADGKTENAEEAQEGSNLIAAVEPAQEAIKEEVTYRPRLRCTGNVTASSENVELVTNNRHSGASSSLNSEPRSESGTSSAHDSTETDASPTGSAVNLSRVGEHVV
jgi:hypothetical protein